MKISDFRIYVRKLAVLCFCLCFVMFAQVHANTLTVTKVVDSNDGACNADCSLREAIGVANNNDIILFEAAAFVNLTQGELRITRDLIIVGTNETKLTITRDSSASPAARIFFVQAGASLTLTNTVVTGGTAPLDFGGGIFNEGTLNLINSEVTGNSASGGGGIDNRGTLNSINSTISNNIAFGQGGIGRGGGIESNGTMTLINTTISNNEATSDNRPFMYPGLGGGIYIQGFGSMTVLRNVTIAGNSATQGSGGGIYGNGTQISLGNTIVANNSAGSSGNGHDIWGGTINSEGYNLIRNTSSVTISGNVTGNILGVDPQLDGLRYNGGMTRTIALQPNSPAIDRGKGTIAGIMNDQRGVARPYDNPNIPNAQGGDGSDIGAFEVQEFAMFIGGRILTASGKPVRNAFVTLTNQTTGETRVALTNPFGYYRFANVPTGQNYVFAVRHKRYTFMLQAVIVNGERSDLNFTASP